MIHRTGLFRCQQAVSAVETAFLLPVILVTVMLLFEIGRLVLVIMLGNYALQSTMDDLRSYQDLDFTDSAGLSEIISQQMLAHAFGYINEKQISPEVIVYSSLHDLVASNDETDENESQAEHLPIILSAYVNIELPYITPLPSLLLLPDTFAYRFHQVVGNFYEQS